MDRGRCLEPLGQRVVDAIAELWTADNKQLDRGVLAGHPGEQLKVGEGAGRQRLGLIGDQDRPAFRCACPALLGSAVAEQHLERLIHSVIAADPNHLQ